MGIQRAKLVKGLLGLAVVAGLGLAVAGYLRLQKTAPTGLLQVNGRIESDQTVVAARVAGKVAALLVREGDAVQNGQALLRLQDDATLARQTQAQAAVGAQTAQVNALQRSLALLREETAVQQQAARAEVVAARAELARVEGLAAQDQRERDRVKKLTDQGFLGPQALERAELAANSSQEQIDAARAALFKAQQNLRNAQLGPQRLDAKAAEVSAAQAQVAMANAQATEATSYINEMAVNAPAAGQVVARYVNAGEVVAPGAPLFGLTDLSKAYLKAYVPEPLIGRLRLGQAAQIWTDAYPEQPFEAKVGFIASRAEFTPKEVQTRDERTKLVFEIRLYPVADPQGRLLPGQPADAMVKLEDGANWQRPSH
jgi:HlyD family secretion protein